MFCVLQRVPTRLYGSPLIFQVCYSRSTACRREETSLLFVFQKWCILVFSQTRMFRSVLPYAHGTSVRKLSKIATLLLAKNYILLLSESLLELQTQLKNCNVDATTSMSTRVAESQLWNNYAPTYSARRYKPETPSHLSFLPVSLIEPVGLTPEVRKQNISPCSVSTTTTSVEDPSSLELTDSINRTRQLALYPSSMNTSSPPTFFPSVSDFLCWSVALSGLNSQ
ncbi:unnamed protein product [Dicrocoelium dendriticum]|nr:unnamed protein product [Dicrocoelium dendriticum]